MSRQCQHFDTCPDDHCNELARSRALTPKPVPTPLEVYEERIKSYPMVSLNPVELLLLDIARSLREQNVIAQAGLEWSKSLASLLENGN